MPAPPLDYESSTPDQSMTTREIVVRTVVVTMAAVWVFAAGHAGVGSDWTRVPPGKKAAIIFAAIIVYVLLVATTPRPGWGVGAGIFAVLAGWMIFVMLVWN